ncbi:hypothetical protein AGOR_G00242320 [Albula goreensis]|uniref:Ubiquitin-like domain-containing protein n=1 Tax=Albula goreensis TaxID=1534307 RepID=A0A8T3CER4_9TELE|nr:hypothetical protein AGOR_G00242320 [Albula goreensis]
MDQHPSARSCTGRGAASCEVVPSEPSMNLYIHSTTGTRFELSLPLDETVEGLKRRLSQRLRVPKERLALLHKETPLTSGKLQEFGIADGSKLTLVPTVETGLMSHAARPEQSIMQALESLTETQVSDFLSGRSPLTLALRVGDHMMFVQLQLAAQQPGGQQLHHRHLITRGGGASVAGLSPASAPGVSGNGGGRVRIPLHAHRVPLSPATSTPPAAPPGACPPPPSVARCSPPPRPLCHPHRLLHPNPPPSAQTTPPPSPSSEANCHTQSPSVGSAPSTRSSQKPGAVIESFVSHAPGVFSGTFSGTLHPNCQDGNGRPRRDVTTILQILNDLLSATRHYQGVPASLTQLRCQTQGGPSPPSPPPSPTATPAGIAGITGLVAKATSVPPTSPLQQCQGQVRMCKPTAGERLRQTENRATRCKVERLQLLMEQKRLRRKARRDARGPYPWLPNRKAGRSNSNSSLSSDASSLDLDYDDSVWKPDVKADINSEFVMA